MHLLKTIFLIYYYEYSIEAAIDKRKLPIKMLLNDREFEDEDLGKDDNKESDDDLNLNPIKRFIKPLLKNPCQTNKNRYKAI